AGESGFDTLDRRAGDTRDLRRRERVPPAENDDFATTLGQFGDRSCDQRRELVRRSRVVGTRRRFAGSQSLVCRAGLGGASRDQIVVPQTIDGGIAAGDEQVPIDAAGWLPAMPL